MIEVRELTKKYKETTVVDIAQLSIQAGEVIGLVGNNGAGKTTFFRLLLDLIRADTGTVLLKGEPVNSTESWKQFTGAYIDDGFLIDYLTPEEYFYFVGKLNRRSKADVDEWLQRFEGFFADAILGKQKYIRDFSKGNQFKIGIVSALLRNPELLILDEPFANLDPSSQLRLVEMIRQLAANELMCILVSSHDLNHVAEVSSRILLMEKGVIIGDMAGGEGAYASLKSYFSLPGEKA